MNKRDFEKYINTQLKDFPLEKVEKKIKKMQEELNKMQNVWLPQILEKKLKNHIKCNKCGKYSKEKDFQFESKIEVSVETTYVDAGYGDDDKMGEVERLIKYRICPICGNKMIESNTFIRIIREWYRCSYKV